MATARNPQRDPKREPDPVEPWWLAFSRQPQTQTPQEIQEETAHIHRWRSPSDPGATGPDEAHKADMPPPPRSWAELEKQGIDPATTTTWRPAIFSRRQTPMPAKRIGSLAPAPRLSSPPPLTPPPPSPVSITLSEWWARMRSAGQRQPDGAALDESHVDLPPRNPDVVSDIRAHGQARKTPPPLLSISRRYSDEDILRHRERTRLHGWSEGDRRCRGCHAYDVRDQHYLEHPVMRWLCLNCQNWLYTVARHHTIGDRLVIMRRIEDILRDPRRSLNMTTRASAPPLLR